MAPSTARAEVGEARIGASPIAVFPALSPQESTQAASVGFGGRLHATVGLLHQRTYLVGRLSLWPHSGDLSQYRHHDADQGSIVGTLRYHGEGYRGEVGCAWQAVSGYSLGVYLHALVGYQWTTYRDQKMVAAFGDEDVTMADRGEGSATGGFGVSVEQRLFDLVLVGVAVDYTRVLSGLYRHDITVGFTSSVAWFPF
jgi:opacity protein-like surface antigen